MGWWIRRIAVAALGHVPIQASVEILQNSGADLLDRTRIPALHYRLRIAWEIGSTAGRLARLLTGDGTCRSLRDWRRIARIGINGSGAVDHWSSGPRRWCGTRIGRTGRGSWR